MVSFNFVSKKIGDVIDFGVSKTPPLNSGGSFINILVMMAHASIPEDKRKKFKPTHLISSFMKIKEHRIHIRHAHVSNPNLDSAS
jgi:hypothetical protein